MDMYCIPELRRHEFYLPALSTPSLTPSLSISLAHTLSFSLAVLLFPYALQNSLTQLLGHNRAGKPSNQLAHFSDI